MNLKEKIEKKKAVVGIIGMGYVGLPLAREFVESSFQVTGFDIDESKVSALNAGESYIRHIPSDLIGSMVKSGKFRATTDFAELQKVDAILICVPTPLREGREPDISYIMNTGKQIRDNLQKEHLIVLESTTFPGTTEEELKPLLEESGLKCGKDFYLAYSPEREDPGNPKYNTRNIPKVVGGCDPASAEMAQALYSQVVVRVVPVSSTREAEACKILENIYRSVNIAMVNELKVLFDKMGINVWEVIDAASTKPFGYQPFYPGPGLGGHCIPIDPFYLSWKARQYNIPTRFIELAGEINTSMPHYVLQRVMSALNEKGKALQGAKVLILGVAYKRDVDDMRESPAITMIELLQSKGATVSYSDPYVPKFSDMREHDLAMESTKLTEEVLQSQDCAIIITDHSACDYEWIVANSDLVVDTRNATKNVKNNRERIVSA